jgi:hypothetical protein
MEGQWVRLICEICGLSAAVFAGIRLVIRAAERQALRRPRLRRHPRQIIVVPRYGRPLASLDTKMGDAKIQPLGRREILGPRGYGG